ncbi:MAG: hypothetical protein H6713_25075 [Myxococcales bacterium]|nr:hypothetical protein [Myxococcales bacterium]MCB9753242.1 hypothetical protein [Myxococcales bacterium]
MLGAIKFKGFLLTYWLVAGASLALLLLGGPRGWLGPGGSRGKVTKQSNKDTVRSRGPTFIWAGGYHGGK